ncbi:MAG TPA: 6-phosphogluconolactonase [Rhizomicrobium sp.]|nr:6-phosphogluconolactonase [Rhizomicrobium sp.]
MDIAGELIVADNADALADAAAEFIVERINKTADVFRMALSGGSTPRGLYTRLGKMPVLPWERMEFFFGDERFVPHDSPDSNFRMVRETLLAHGAQPKAVRPIPVDGTPDDAAARYEILLKSVYGADVWMPERRLFDLNLLGLGEDGHIASLLPGEPVLQERQAWVKAVPHGRAEPRITLTYPALEASTVTMFLVSGASKADALRRARAGDTAIPAGRLQPRGSVVWFVDRAAAQA